MDYGSRETLKGNIEQRGKQVFIWKINVYYIAPIVTNQNYHYQPASLVRCQRCPNFCHVWTTNCQYPTALFKLSVHLIDGLSRDARGSISGSPIQDCVGYRFFWSLVSSGTNSTPRCNDNHTSCIGISQIQGFHTSHIYIYNTNCLLWKQMLGIDKKG